MIVDIKDWGLKPYNTWGFFYVPSHLIQTDTRALLSYCANLDSNCAIIVFISTEHLAGINHAFLACYFAAKAMSRKCNRAKDLGMEVLLYLSGQDQINAAITRAGISDQQKNRQDLWAVVFFSSSNELLLVEKRKLETFLKVSFSDAISDPKLPEKLTVNLISSAVHLDVLDKQSHPIPLIPVKPASNQETAYLHWIIEKMVILSLDEIKSEF